LMNESSVPTGRVVRIIYAMGSVVYPMTWRYLDALEEQDLNIIPADVFESVTVEFAERAWHH
jgi:hypothetical protein